MASPKEYFGVGSLYQPVRLVSSCHKKTGADGLYGFTFPKRFTG